MSDIDAESPIDDESDDAFEAGSDNTEQTDIDIRESKEDALRRKRIRQLLERQLERKRLREELDDFIDLDEAEEDNEDEELP